MRSRLSLALVLIALIHTTGYGQSSTYGLYCAAGLHPDGYIDFSGLPPAPNITQTTPSAAVTATLPVQAVPGLTVTVTIPALYGGGSAKPTAAYTVDGGTLTLNGLSHTDSGTVLILTFSQPIAGVGVHTVTNGRFNYSNTLQVGLPPGDSEGIFATTATGYTYDDYVAQTHSLQIVGLSTFFQTASLQGEEDETMGITLSNVRVQSASAPNPASLIPTNGLQQWLMGGGTGTWVDQSGHGHDATPSANAPLPTADGLNCQPASQFTGNQSLNFNLPIAGWNEMTVFVVAKAGNDSGSYANNTAILWPGDEPWGNTFVSPYQTHLYASFGTTQSSNYLLYTRSPGSIGQDFTTTRAVHNHGTDSLYVNGLPVESREGKLATLGGNAGAGIIGQGFDGEISEILVYNRALSADEAALVESYLGQKYGYR